MRRVRGATTSLSRGTPGSRSLSWLMTRRLDWVRMTSGFGGLGLTPSGMRFLLRRSFAFLAILVYGVSTRYLLYESCYHVIAGGFVYFSTGRSKSGRMRRSKQVGVVPSYLISMRCIFKSIC